MESQNYKVISGFLKESFRERIISYVNSINKEVILQNHHLKHLVGQINGASYMYDIGKTQMTSEITRYQSGGFVMDEELPPVFDELVTQISSLLNIPSNDCFLQIVDMNRGGKIGKHYDASFPGYINYKCNISVLAEDYDFVVDGEALTVHEGDLYCFEASLYKHWTPNPFHARRVLLSFGFMLPYEVLGRTPDDPRVRLSRRINKYFQN
jgi:hypothetical protein